MTAQLLSLPVPIRSADEATARQVSAVAATLPRSFRPARADEAAVEVISGPGWLPRLLDRATGARGVILVDPPYPRDEAALPPGFRPACPVLVDAAGSSDAIVADARAALAAAIRRGAPEGAGWRLECRATTSDDGDLETVLTHQLLLVRTLVGATAELRVLTWSDSGYAALARTGRLSVDLTAVRTGVLPASTSVRLLTGDGGIELWLPDGASARPAELTITSVVGELRSPTRWEAGRRTAWRQLLSLLQPGSEPPAGPGLPELLADIAQVRSARHAEFSRAVSRAF